jgi:DNA-directed RNA polymerase subunit RPC12/RpoP
MKTFEPYDTFHVRAPYATRGKTSWWALCYRNRIIAYYLYRADAVTDCQKLKARWHMHYLYAIVCTLCGWRRLYRLMRPILRRMDFNPAWRA